MYACIIGQPQKERERQKESFFVSFLPRFGFLGIEIDQRVDNKLHSLVLLTLPDDAMRCCAPTRVNAAAASCCAMTWMNAGCWFRFD